MAKKVEIFAGVYLTGDLPVDVQIRVREAVRAHAGKDIKITVERKRKKRSLNQNQYYWGVVVPAVQELLAEYGNEVDAEETHSFLKEHVGKLVDSITDKSGRRLAVVKSSAKLSTAEFEAYLEKVRRWAATEGVSIPEPHEDINNSLGERRV